MFDTQLIHTRLKSASKFEAELLDFAEAVPHVGALATVEQRISCAIAMFCENNPDINIEITVPPTWTSEEYYDLFNVETVVPGTLKKWTPDLRMHKIPLHARWYCKLLGIEPLKGNITWVEDLIQAKDNELVVKLKADDGQKGTVTFGFLDPIMDQVATEKNESDLFWSKLINIETMGFSLTPNQVRMGLLNWADGTMSKIRMELQITKNFQKSEAHAEGIYPNGLTTAMLREQGITSKQDRAERLNAVMPEQIRKYIKVLLREGPNVSPRIMRAFSKSYISALQSKDEKRIQTVILNKAPVVWKKDKRLGNLGIDLRKNRALKAMAERLASLGTEIDTTDQGAVNAWVKMCEQETTRYLLWFLTKDLGIDVNEAKMIAKAKKLGQGS